jgi:glutaredoxin
MSKKLDSWGVNYHIINISEDIEAKKFLKENNHRTVPQLYWNDIHLNKVDTEDFTRAILFKEVQLYHDMSDSGVENFG